MTDAGMDDATTDHKLPDGSVCRIEQRTHRTYMVSRWIGSRCVWGQAFTYPGGVDGVGEWESDIVTKMAMDPQAFYRWNLTE